MRTVSGTQYVLKADRAEATIASIGATLRRFQHYGRDVVMPFAHDVERPALSGALLAPWPNRTADAQYRFNGELHTLAMNEPERRNAAHGLAFDLDFALVGRDEQEVCLTAVIQPRPGYPWRMRLDVRFTLNEEGLSQVVTARNEGTAPGPVGLGGHPYLVAGEAQRCGIDDWILEVPASEVLPIDPERFLPGACVDVGQHGDGSLDFRAPRRIGTTVMNNAFSKLRRGAGGRAVVRLLNEQGRGAELELGAECKWVQIYTADVPGSPGHRQALAVEPMTCPPDALNSGRDLTTLSPGQSTEVAWTLRGIAG